jgi:hypothetical protein
MWRDGEFEMFMWTLIIGGAAIGAGITALVAWLIP